MEFTGSQCLSYGCCVPINLYAHPSDNCIKLLDQTYVKYHLLFYVEGMNTLMPTRQFGSAKGLIIMGEDFDDELRDFKEYM